MDFSKEIHWYLSGTFTFSHAENAILGVLGEAEKADFNAKMLTLKEKKKQFERLKVFVFELCLIYRIER